MGLVLVQFILYQAHLWVVQYPSIPIFNPLLVATPPPPYPRNVIITMLEKRTKYDVVSNNFGRRYYLADT
jgi:hypothetical protein